MSEQMSERARERERETVACCIRFQMRGLTDHSVEPLVPRIVSVRIFQPAATSTTHRKSGINFCRLRCDSSRSREFGSRRWDFPSLSPSLFCLFSLSIFMCTELYDSTRSRSNRRRRGARFVNSNGSLIRVSRNQPVDLPMGRRFTAGAL